MKESDLNSFENIKKILSREKKAIIEIDFLFNYSKNTRDEKEKRVVISQIGELESYIKNRNDDLLRNLEEISFARPLKEKKKKSETPKKKTEPLIDVKKRGTIKRILEKEKLTRLEKETLRRVRERITLPLKEKEEKPNKYINLANKLFSDLARKLAKNDFFIFLSKDLVRTNLQLTPISYISMILLTVTISEIVAVFIFIFFLFFSLQNFPFITVATGSFLTRVARNLWILFAVPLGTFMFMYFYPSMERRSAENKINQELPFATIHMSTISGSMIEPSKIFSIIITTKEYPNLEKEFKKLLNLINVYGYDLVTALKNSAAGSPSNKLADLFNGLATTIISGGDLSNFFNKRSETLLYDYKLEREKYIKFSETFMDIYISIVIAAPMILMLLLLMLRLGGLGISLSSRMITTIMVLGVSVINVVFLGFLRLKQPAEY